ncbi:VOC family protein [Agreia bicolorata]|uniref:3-demethylubiquinone-9 3-methyltransferase n=1 Tax=Agreia bicolorata TaxID=110935 RepID=A0ABR5CE20_9MICO|nr:VOC family protein [Agreia bicolorata]KJC63881.1 3-demethylubiquinone-9 3-methyltransferase [Agreia bicolorata]
MSTTLNPYLSFRGNAKEAMEFYHSVFGGELTMSRYAEFGMNEDPSEADKIMHAQLVTSGGLTLMGADTPNSMPFNPGNTYSVSLSGQDVDELTGYWQKLSEGATIQMPLEKAPWGDSFGQLIDRFGVGWMVNIGGSPDAPTPQA